MPPRRSSRNRRLAVRKAAAQRHLLTVATACVRQLHRQQQQRRLAASAPAVRPSAPVPPPRPSAPALGPPVALLFGLNYSRTAGGSQLQGCINDVRNMQAYLSGTLGVRDIRLFADNTAGGFASCSRTGILQNMRQVAAIRPAPKFVWIHFSGHGTWMADRNGDERDRRDECIVPANYPTAGYIVDDELRTVFAGFAPETAVVAVFDSCFSGTVADLTFSWPGGASVPKVSESPPMAAKILMLSGCRDTQTSADAYGLEPGNPTGFTGAMTSCLLAALAAVRPAGAAGARAASIFTVIADLRARLAANRFTQVPQLTSSYDLVASPAFLAPCVP